MIDIASAPSPTPASDLPTLLRRLCHARWWWLALALLLALATPAMLQVALPLPAIVAVIAVTAAINAATLWRLRQPRATDDTEFFLQLSIDLLALSALLFFSGGATNPLISLLLPLVAMAALSLPLAYVIALTLLAILAYSALMVYYLPLPLSDPIRGARLHLAGMWLTFAFSAALMAWLLLRTTAQIRRRDAALAAAREHALREERVLALGALAAGAAHELGTPLATMALLAGELDHEAGLSPEGREDLQTLQAQIRECKAILTTLAARAGVERAESARRLALDVWVKQVRERWRNLRPGAECRLEFAGNIAPTIAADPTLEQAVINLLNNAARVMQKEITVIATWDAAEWRLEIRDDGPGFPPEVLAGAGHQPFPAHNDGSGIGMLLSMAAIKRLGGELELYNPPEGGAVARIRFAIHA